MWICTINSKSYATDKTITAVTERITEEYIVS